MSSESGQVSQQPSCIKQGAKIVGHVVDVVGGVSYIGSGILLLAAKGALHATVFAALGISGGWIVTAAAGVLIGLGALSLVAQAFGSGPTRRKAMFGAGIVITLLSGGGMPLLGIGISLMAAAMVRVCFTRYMKTPPAVLAPAESAELVRFRQAKQAEVDSLAIREQMALERIREALNADAPPPPVTASTVSVSVAPPPQPQMSASSSPVPTAAPQSTVAVPLASAQPQQSVVAAPASAPQVAEPSVSANDVIKIETIIQALAMAPLVAVPFVSTAKSLWARDSELRDLGDSLKNTVHPLQFLEVIFTNSTFRKYMKQINERSAVIGQFKREHAANFKSQASKNSKYIECFISKVASSMRLNSFQQNELRVHIDKSEGEALITKLIAYSENVAS